MPNAIGLPELAVGLLPFDLPDGPTTSPSGQPRSHANHSAQPGISERKRTSATSGQCSPSLFGTGSLQSRLESRLRANLDVNGSLEFEMIWKEWGMKSGLPICALRASERRTDDNGSTGWPTPSAIDSVRGVESKEARKARGSHTGTTLNDAAAMAPWPTCSARDYKSGESIKELTNSRPLSETVLLAAWHTPHCPRKNDSQFSASSYLDRQLGTRSTSSTASTEKRGALNPEHSRWLMGYPAAWGSCGDTGIASCRKSRKSSSVPVSKP